LQIPGVTNGWTQPIINRINMLSTGIRTDVGVKIYGQNLDTINQFAQMIKKELDGIAGIKDLYAEPITGGKYIDIVVKRDEISRYGLTVDDVNMIVESALGGVKLTTTVEGRQRFSVNARFGQEFRNNITALKRLQVQTINLGPIPLEAVADIKISEGPPMINSENALLRGTVLFNVRERDLGSTVAEAQDKLNKMLQQLPKGYFLEWSGQYENLIRSEKTLKLILPVVLLIIFLSMYFAFGSAREALLSLISIPFALIGGAYMVYFWGANLSVAVSVGFIALF
jgi:copper/silver efflux system protein